MDHPHPRPRRRGNAHDQRGQALSAFVAVVLSALFGVAGLVVDGGAKSAAKAEAESVAAHAARAAVDASARARATGTPLDVGAVIRAGSDVIADRGITGQVTITDGVVRVTTTTSTRTVFLSLIGITSLTASGEATASLQR